MSQFAQSLAADPTPEAWEHRRDVVIRHRDVDAPRITAVGECALYSIGNFFTQTSFTWSGLQKVDYYNVAIEYDYFRAPGFFSFPQTKNMQELLLPDSSQYRDREVGAQVIFGGHDFSEEAAMKACNANHAKLSDSIKK